MTIAKPTQIATPFANSGLKNTIPQSATGSNLASLEEGFPTKTMTAVADGGVPPQGQDMNGILYQITNQLRYSQAGGLYPYNSAFCTAIGGYPLGAILMSADGSKLWQNRAAGNINNPDSNDTNWKRLADVDALAGYLPLSGGTVTGKIITTAINDFLRIKSSAGEMSLNLNANGNRGIYDYDADRWLLFWSGTDDGFRIYARDGSCSLAGVDGNLTASSTPAKSDSSTKLATTAFVKNVAGDYLPLAGGTMTGTIMSSQSDFTIRKTTTAGRLLFRGGTNYNDGASLYLNGKDVTNGDAAKFSLLCHDGSSNSSLTGAADGTLTWGGKDVEAVDSKSITNETSAYFRFKSGLQLCWGYVTSSSTSVSVTYPKAFASVPQVFVTSNSAGNPKAANNITATKFNFESEFAATGSGGRWLAIGRWK